MFGCLFNARLVLFMRGRSPDARADVHYAIVDPQALSRNELCFLVEQHLTLVAIWLPHAIEMLSAK